MKMTSLSIMYKIILSTILIILLQNGPAHSLTVHKEIRGSFTSLADATKACLKCHTPQAHEVLQSTHWTWVRQRNINGKNLLFGKKDSLTGFAIDVSSNPQRCMRCHVSITRPEVNLKAPKPDMIDCLICHDTTGIYAQTGKAGINSLDQKQFTRMIQNAGIPGQHNCRICHFTDCGLPITQGSSTDQEETAQISDIHLDNKTTAFSCQKCHGQRNGHNFSRTILVQNPPKEEGCASCHTSSPHSLAKLNEHGKTIACRTCHIPEYARKEPKIIGWNWMMIGKTNRVFQAIPNGRALVQDENGFTSARQIEPVYLWDDGTDQVYTRGQRIRPQEMTFLQKPSEKTPNAKIAPFRVVYGTQMYDAKYRYLISPLLQSNGTVFFPEADWGGIAQKGMEAVLLPFSGEYGFATTVRFQRLNHGVAPAEEALGCVDCHGAKGRLPWKDLGYDGDPWAERKSAQNGTTKEKSGMLLQGYSQLSKR